MSATWALVPKFVWLGSRIGEPDGACRGMRGEG